MENIINPIAFGLAMNVAGLTEVADLMKKTMITRLALDKMNDKVALTTKVVDRGGNRAVAIQESYRLTNKVLYLNALSKKETGMRFINGYIDLNDENAVLGFAQAFVDFVLNYTPEN